MKLTQVVVAASIVALMAIGAPAADAQKGGKGIARQGPTKFSRLQTAPNRQATPLRYARVNANGTLAEPWREYVQTDWPGGLWFVAFDCFEADPASADGTPYDGSYGVMYNGAGLGGNRWFFGPGYKNAYAVNDMRSASGFALGTSSRTSFSWYWEGASGEPCIVVISTFENFGATPAGVAPSTAADGFLNGYAFDFGTALAPGGYFAGVNLTGANVFRLPVDGSGGYAMILANAVSPSLTLASLGQPFLWFTKPNNPSFQGPIQWDDDNPADAIHMTEPPGNATTREWYDYTGAVASVPVPAGAMVAFYSHQEVVAPSSVILQNGTFVGGNLASLARSDDDRYRTKLNLASDELGHQVQILMTCVSPLASPASFDVVIEDRGSIPGTTRTVSLFNWTTNQWVEMGTGTTTATDKTVAYSASGDLSRFVQAGTRAVRCRLGYDLIFADEAVAWSVDLDLAVFRIGHPAL